VTRLSPARAAAALSGSLALLLLVGAAAARPLDGGARASAVPLEPVLVVAGTGLVLSVALGIGALGGLRELAGLGGGGPARPGLVVRTVAILVPVLIISIYAAVGATGRHRHPPPAPTSHGNARPRAEREVSAERASRDLAALAAGIALGLAALGVVAVRRRRPADADAPTPRATVAAGVRDALAALALPADPRAAILAAYQRMEAALAHAGLARRESEAPREYLTRLEGSLGAVRAPAGRLTALFERARFSPHPVDEEGRREAIDALGILRAELERPE
jgi:Domain of unknown function (DUF4129)